MTVSSEESIKKLVNYVRMNLDDRYYDASPEDIVQDVVLSLVSRLNPDTQIGNLTGYIYRSLKNKIIDYRKKKQRTVSMATFRGRHNFGPWRHRHYMHNFQNCHDHSYGERWSLYDQFWTEEGEKAFHDYLSRKGENPVKE